MAPTRTGQHIALDQTLSNLRDQIDEARALADEGQQAALTPHLLKLGRTLYSAIALTEISPSGDPMIDLRNPSS